MATVAQQIESEAVVLLPVGQLHKSPTQPRRRGPSKLDPDFVASIRAKGVLQPIIVRERDHRAGWEIVFGHRRHAGSVTAERETIPAIVREMTDEEVFEAQLIENIQRSDMHPLDEADGFQRMLFEHKRTQADIAARIGRPVAYVHQRLKLCELGKEARAALDSDKISLGIALLIARIPAQLQVEALKQIWQGMGVAEAKSRLEEVYLLRLDQAPFDIKDANLVPAAGPCTTCPKRTGQQRELFPDAARADLCIDRVCYRNKLDALWAIKKKEAKEGGAPVIEGKEAQSVFAYNGAYRRLDQREWIDGKDQTVRKLLGKNLPPVAWVRDDNTGAPVEVVRRADVDKVIKQARKGEDRYNPQTGLKKSDEDKLKRQAAAVTTAIGQAVAKASKLPAAHLQALLVQALLVGCWDEIHQAIIKRRAIDIGKHAPGDDRPLLKYFAGLKKPADIAGLGLEIALREIAPGKYKDAPPEWSSTLKKLGVNFAAIEKKLADEAKAKKTAKKKG